MTAAGLEIFSRIHQVIHCSIDTDGHVAVSVLIHANQALGTHALVNKPLAQGSDLEKTLVKRDDSFECDGQERRRFGCDVEEDAEITSGASRI